MKNSGILWLVGFLPILLGFVISFLPLPIPFFLTNLLFYALWIWMIFRFSNPHKSFRSQFLPLGLPGTVVIALALLQELVPGIALPSWIIHASQFYFFSGVQSAGRILTPFLSVITAWPYYAAAYLLMSTAALLVVIVKRKVT